ncbi:hypothetical protein AURDEDRAFT_126205 [Auricularia subglabra TFB-10046 SS5]|nr:hypothetical protein AURDEDRAFT_126205 [Auricularia subglabra TFB-10046 SS5]
MHTAPNVLRTVLKGKYVYIDRCVFWREGEEDLLLKLKEKILALGAKITFTLPLADIVLVAGMRTMLDEALRAVSGVLVYSWYIDDVYDAASVPTSSRYFVDRTAIFPYDVQHELRSPRRPSTPMNLQQIEASSSTAVASTSVPVARHHPYNIADPTTPESPPMVSRDPTTPEPPPIVSRHVSSAPLRPYKSSNLPVPTTPTPNAARLPAVPSRAGAADPLLANDTGSTASALPRTYHPTTPPPTGPSRRPLRVLEHPVARQSSPATMAEELEVAGCLLRKRKNPPSPRDDDGQLSESSDDSDNQDSLYLPSGQHSESSGRNSADDERSFDLRSIHQFSDCAPFATVKNDPNRRSISLGPPMSAAASEEQQQAPEQQQQQAPQNPQSFPPFPIPTFQFPSNRSDFQYPEVRQYAAQALAWMVTYTQLGKSPAPSILTKASVYLWKVSPDELRVSSMYNCVKKLHDFRNDLLIVIRAARKKAAEEAVEPHTLDQLDNILDTACQRYLDCRSTLTSLKQAARSSTPVRPPVPQSESQRPVRKSSSQYARKSPRAAQSGHQQAPVEPKRNPYACKSPRAAQSDDEQAPVEPKRKKARK